MMFLVTVYLSVSRSLLFFSSHSSPFPSSFCLPFLVSSAPTLDEANSQLHAPTHVCHASKGSHMVPWVGWGSWRPPVPLTSSFPPVLVPEFLDRGEDYHLQSKWCSTSSTVLPSHRIMRWTWPGKAPQVCIPLLPLSQVSASLELLRVSCNTAVTNPEIQAFRKWSEDPQAWNVWMERKIFFNIYVCFPFHTLTINI